VRALLCARPGELALDDAPKMFPHWLRPSSGVVKALIEI
jgi:hypothetical protein